MKNILLIFFTSLLLLGCNKEDKEDKFLNINIDNIEVSGTGGDFSIQIISNTAWDVINNFSWISTYSPEKIKDNTFLLKINIHSNNSFNRRDAIITIKSEDITKNISIKQEQNNVIITNENIFEFDFQGGTKDFVYKSNIKTQILVKPENDWIHITNSPKTKSLSDYNINILVDPNRGNSREATLIIYGEDEKKEIKIKQKEFIQLESIKFEEGNELFVSDLDEIMLHPIFYPSNCSNKDIIWYSSNPDIIEVDNIGKVKIHKNGEVLIYAQNKESNIKSHIKITTKIKATKLFTIYNNKFPLDNYTISANLGDVFKFSIMTNPDIAYKDDITIKSSNISLAYIDEKDVICNNTKEGIVQIIIEDDYSKLSTSFKIDIRDMYKNTKEELFASWHRIDQRDDGFFMSFAGEIISVNPRDKFEVLDFYLMDQNGVTLTHYGNIENNNTNDVMFITEKINLTETHGIHVLRDEVFELLSKWKMRVSYMKNDENKLITESINLNPKSQL